MRFCPFISTPDNKVYPSSLTCKDCYFYVAEPMTASTYCAIVLAADRASQAAGILKGIDKNA